MIPIRWFRFAPLALCLGLAGCMGLQTKLASLKEPKISLAGLSVKRLDLFQPSVLVRLNVENPNAVNVSIDGADLALALNGQPVANGISHSPLTLVGHGTSTMDVEIQADTLGIAQQVLRLQKQSQVNYDVSGHLNVLNWLGPLGQIPIKLQGSMDRDTLLRGAEGLGKLKF